MTEKRCKILGWDGADFHMVDEDGTVMVLENATILTADDPSLAASCDEARVMSMEISFNYAAYKPFDYGAQRMVLYFAMEKGDPSRHPDWYWLTPQIKKEWPEFWAAWLAYDAEETEQSISAFEAVCASTLTEVVRIKNEVK